MNSYPCHALWIVGFISAIFFNAGDSKITWTNGNLFTTKIGKRSTLPEYRTTEAENSLSCMFDCMDDDRCYGIHYDSILHICEMKTYAHNPGFTNDANSTFYKKVVRVCPTGFKYIGVKDTCFQFARSKKKYSDAKTACMNRNANLVSVETELKYEVIKYYENTIPALGCSNANNWAKQLVNQRFNMGCTKLDHNRWYTDVDSCYKRGCWNSVSGGELHNIAVNWRPLTHRCFIKRCPTPDMKVNSDSNKYTNVQYIGHKYWTSGKQVSPEGKWKWSNGQSLSWGSDELVDRNNGKQDGLVLLARYPGKRINDDTLGYQFHYICEYK